MHGLKCVYVIVCPVHICDIFAYFPPSWKIKTIPYSRLKIIRFVFIFRRIPICVFFFRHSVVYFLHRYLDISVHRQKL